MPVVTGKTASKNDQQDYGFTLQPVNSCTTMRRRLRQYMYSQRLSEDVNCCPKLKVTNQDHNISAVCSALWSAHLPASVGNTLA